MSDLINRKELWKAFTTKFDCVCSLGEVRKTIDSVPTAEPKEGKWIKNEHGLKCCSVCGKRPLEICYFDIDCGYTGKEILSKYCPECGAKMERGE